MRLVRPGVAPGDRHRKEEEAVEHAVLFAVAVALLAVGGRMLRTSGAALGLPVAVVALTATVATR